MDDFFKLESSIRELDQSVRLLVAHLMQVESLFGYQDKKTQIH